TESEWRDPENASSATLIRGVLPKLRVAWCGYQTTPKTKLAPAAFATSFGSTFSGRSRERAFGDSYSEELPESAMRRAHPPDLSAPPQVASLLRRRSR